MRFFQTSWIDIVDGKPLGRGLTLQEALALERESFRKLEQEIEDGLKEEAQYWAFLDDDDKQENV